MRDNRCTSPRSPLVWLIAAGLLAGTMAGVAQASWGWAESQTAQNQLLPGTTIGGVNVGGLRAEEAITRLDRRLDGPSREPISVVHGDRSWTVQPAELGATLQPRTAVQTALVRSDDVAWPRLAWAHWLDGPSGVEIQVPLRADEERLAGFVDRVAGAVDRSPRSAGASWSPDGAQLIAHRHGRRLDRAALTDELVAALRDGSERVTAEVATVPADVTTGEVAPLLTAVESSVDAALNRRVTVTADGRRWEVSARQVGATPDMDATLAAHRSAASGRSGAGETLGASGELARLDIPQAGLDATVDELAGEIDVAARDAGLDSSGGWVEVVGGRAGRTLQREAAVRRIGEALRRDGASTVSLPVERLEPEVTTAAYDDVLLLRQEERRLYHYVDGEIAAQWPVAVGAGGSPTPTGRFTVGAKRHRPTWHNPAPDGWGADMPTAIEPGPSNPLGVRALNWYADGADTLIRFHGTANEASIGRAASQGCVRLSNPDVVQLYQRVPPGTPIVSVSG